MNGIVRHKSGGDVKSRIKSSLQVNDTPTKDFAEVEGYLVTFGHERDTDLQGEFFTERTELCLDWFGERPVLYHHGLDGTTGLRKIGSIKSIEQDDLGWWVKAQLDLRDRYGSAVYDMVKSSEFGWSSGSVDHLVKIAPNGEIAVWPLIEGSITPTPAQPAKTTVRAMKSNVVTNMPNIPLAAIKSILANDSDKFISDYLMQLNARVEFAEELMAGLKSSDGSRVKSFGGVVSDSAKRLAAAYARAYGLKTTDVDLSRIAQKAEEAVAQEMALISPEDSETLDVLEQEMVGSDSVKKSARKNNKNNGQVNQFAEKMADEIIDDMKEELNMGSELEQEVKRIMRAKRAARHSAARRGAYRRAYRTGLDAEVMNEAPIEAGGGGDLDYLGDQAAKRAARRARIMNAARRASASARRSSRARRGYSYREGGESVVPEEVVLAESPEQVIAEEVAAASYRRGARAMARSLMSVRSNDLSGIPYIEENNNEIGAKLSRRSPVRRNSYRTENIDEQAADVIEDAMSKSASKRAALKRLARARRSSYRTETAPVEAVVEEEVVTPAAASFRSRRARRNANMNEFDETAIASDPLADDLIGTASYRGGRRSSFRGKSMDNGNAEYWKRRAIKAEMAEAPGQRGFGNVSVRRDEGDQHGAYGRAFKSYLMQGLGMMTDREKSVLKAKGTANFGNNSGTFSVDRASGAIKTYYGGNDASAGFLVPPDWIAELNKNIMTQTVMAAECRTRTTTSDRVIQPTLKTTDARRAHAAVVKWVGETNATEASTATTEDTFTQKEIPIHILLMNISASNQSLEDVSFSLEDEISEAFSEATAIAYDSLIYSGDGVGKLQGIVTDNTVVGHRSTGLATVGGYIPSGSASGIVSADAIKEMFLALPRQYRAKAKWYMNSDTALQISTLKDGNGNYLIDQRDSGLTSIVGAPETLMNRPIVYNEWASDIASGAYPIVFGDLMEGYLIAKRVDFSIRRFDDSAQALNDRVLFIGRARLGGQVIRPASMKVLKIATS